MPSFGKSSARRLKRLCPAGVEVAHDAIHILDFSVIETSRSMETQNAYFSAGTSTLRWPESKHNTTPERPLSEAMDLWPYIPPFGALSGHPDQIATIALITGRLESEVRDFVYKAYARLAGVIEACSFHRGHIVRWGGDWDGDGNLLDQKFHDLQHFEFIEG